MPSLLRPGSWAEAQRLAAILRTETAGGLLLIGAALVGLVWANSPWWHGYESLRDLQVGPAALHLDLSLHAWAADGLLAIFFFVVGLELKREFVAGDLRDPRRAALPILAAVGGMIVPALIFVAVTVRTGGDALAGWAVPTATDIAFALAVLALLGAHLPAALRTFLLTLAVVDDLLAVTVIAVFYTDDLRLGYLAAAAVPLAVFLVAARRRLPGWLLPVPAVLTWWLVHQSGVHATVAGVLLGLAVPVLAANSDGPGPAERLEHRVRPLSAGFAVPVFAFFAAGVHLGGASAFGAALRDPITVGVVAGLVLGKVVGIVLTSYLLATFTRSRLDDDLAWVDVLGVGLLAGIGFTVSLLIADLAYDDPLATDHASIGVFLATGTAAILAALVLTARNRAYRRIAERERRDDDNDGIPDIYQP
ncbi:Na+/H+ antiporter NhaA [Nocardia asteroides]|uniref:Na+/H+ antiporter NhaA n=1 Tax=Nocardia asteroides TaxID=1824 RepID=UPI001E482E63|nr:Na+/H+ antiporter NhaA [Nocardia asteroides]UGT63100.1 Na+/H+ antiporter NhaA [Nocardia asteroides]